MSGNIEFSQRSLLYFPVNVRSLPPKGMQLQLKTDIKERKALAKAHDLVNVLEFSAVFDVLPWKKQGVRIEGEFEAEIEQICVITGEPLRNHLHEKFDACFLPRNSRLATELGENHELLLDPEGEDSPEIFNGNEIDAGALAEEFFELAIDRYPRKKNASLRFAGQKKSNASNVGAESDTSEEKHSERPVSPFAVLKSFKKG